MTRLNVRVSLAAMILALAAGIVVAEEVVIEMKAVAGMRFEPARFVVPPGAKVKLILENTDLMQHNLLLVAPGSRVEVVTDALALGADGPKLDFIPKSDKVMLASKMLGPGATQVIEFTAPAKEDIYPYVCTNVGHGFLMYGAMYVTRDAKDLPPEETDPNLPPPLPQAMVAHTGHGHGPQVQRTFMPDAGPAAIAVDTGMGNSYCFDAGQARLRYAWTGGFIDDVEHLASSGDIFAKVQGRIWWRAGDAWPLHIGEPSGEPKVEWHGYRLIHGVPELRYSVNGVEVRELITSNMGGEGLVRQFNLESVDRPVYFVAEPGRGATFAASAGEWDGPVLKLSPTEARQFTITMTPDPNAGLPLVYWSMNDVPTRKLGLEVPGVIGRAVPFDGKKGEIKTGLNLKDLAAGSTILLWFKLDPKKEEQVILGGRNGELAFSIGYLLVKGKGKDALAITSSNHPHAGGSTSLGVASGRNAVNLAEWTPLAITIEEEKASLIVPTEKARSPLSRMSPFLGPVKLMDIELFLGSNGGKQFLKGAIDEFRVYDRVLSEQEIRRIFDAEAPGRKEARR